jgi:hypothetical protein
MDAMELRGWASQNPRAPSRDLTDPLGEALFATLQGQNDALSDYLTERQKTASKEELLKEMYEKRWGPTKIPIFNVILPFLYVSKPEQKPRLLDLTRHLVDDIGVGVDGTDVNGSTALYWAISTKPFVEPEFAQILFDAGCNLNQKNRFGCTAASEIAQADLGGDTSKSVKMLKWYVQHGGDVEVKDNDGMNVKMLVEMMEKRVPAMAQVLREGRGVRKEGQCANCGREPKGEKALLTCSRCKKTRYCSGECQKVDWKGHKKGCKAA